MDAPILEKHSFRQTQTAITAQVFCRDGFQLAYKTPVVGAPWALPIEFPTFQFVVSVLKNLTTFKLDLIGRAVSWMFFYSGLVYIYLISKRYLKDSYSPLVIVSCVLLHPVYIFWSRTFLIESTALFFCLMYLYHSQRAIQDASSAHVIIGAVAGVLAGLTKSTTFMAFAALISLEFLRWWCFTPAALHRPGKSRLSLTALGILAAPCLAIVWWNVYSDQIRSSNAYAYSFTSSEWISSWAFGKLRQKFSFSTWKLIGIQSQVYHPAVYTSIISLLAYGALSGFKYLREAGVCFFLYLVPPLVLTNLYVIHDYYAYANCMFLCACIGFTALSFIEENNSSLRFVGVTFLCANLTFFTIRYINGYGSIQGQYPSFVVEAAETLRQITHPDEVVLVYGNDWGAEYAYYSERRTIGIRDVFEGIHDPGFLRLMEQNSSTKIGGMVFVRRFGMYREPFLNQIVTQFEFHPVMHAPEGIVYRKGR